uniref:KVN n=1 Tax=Littorina littorea TaxID=31216 RepID=Q8T9M0_LITLI|nr:KVN [Littorina littorea]
MKCVILLALVAVAFAQHRPDFDHGDPLEHLVMAEVENLIRTTAGISETDCEAKCDAMFDLAAGHDEDRTDHLCAEECKHQLQAGPHSEQPTHPPHPTHP